MKLVNKNIVIEFYLKTPQTSGDIVNDYLKVLEENKEYDAWTINERLEVIECKGSIKNNESWNYHNNYDSSENELYVGTHTKWFSLNKGEVINIQKENISRWKLELEQELLRLENLF